MISLCDDLQFLFQVNVRCMMSNVREKPSNAFRRILSLTLTVINACFAHVTIISMISHYVTVITFTTQVSK